MALLLTCTVIAPHACAQEQAPEQEQLPMLAPLLEGFAKEDSSPLPSSSKLLFGGIQQRLSSMTAVQHKKLTPTSTSTFHANLTPLTPMFAPNSPRKLEAEVSQSRPLLFDLLVNKKRPLVGEVVTTRPTEDPNLLSQRPSTDQDVVDKQKPIPVVDVTQPKDATTPDLKALKPETAVPTQNRPTIVDVSERNRPNPQSFVPGTPKEEDINRPPPEGRTSLIADRPSIDGGYVHQHPGQGANIDSTKIRTQPLTDETVRGKLRTIPNLDTVKNTTIALRPEENVSGLLKPNKSGTTIDEKRPNIDDTFQTRHRTDATVIASKPQLDTDVDVIRKRHEPDVTIPRPTLQVIYRKPVADTTLSTDADIVKKKEPEALRAQNRGELKPSSNTSVQQDTTGRILSRNAERNDQHSKIQADSKISWDQWYADLSKLCEPLLAEYVEKHGNAAGSNSIQLTVTRDHHLTAKLVKGSHDDFDTATLEAYSKLDGNAALAFPPNSKRHQVKFFVDHNHETNDPVYVDSRSIVGDEEAATEH